MERRGAAALQYSVTEGIPEMRRWVAERLTRRTSRIVQADDVTIVNGSQQGLDLVGKIFLDPGDHVVLEHPSYLGAIQAFDAYQARYLTVETDEDGAIPESLERVLDRADPFPKFVYLVRTSRTPPAGRWRATPRAHRPHLRALRSADRRGRSLRRTALRRRGYSAARFVREHRADHLLRYRQQDHVARDARCVARRSRRRDSRKDRSRQARLGSAQRYLRAIRLPRIRQRRSEFDRHVATIARTYRRRRDVMADALDGFAHRRDCISCRRTAACFSGSRFRGSTRPSCSQCRRAESRLRARGKFLSPPRRARRHAVELFECLGRDDSRGHRTSRSRHRLRPSVNGAVRRTLACHKDWS